MHRQGAAGPTSDGDDHDRQDAAGRPRRHARQIGRPERLVQPRRLRRLRRRGRHVRPRRLHEDNLRRAGQRRRGGQRHLLGQGRQPEHAVSIQPALRRDRPRRHGGAARQAAGPRRLVHASGRLLDQRPRHPVRPRRMHAGDLPRAGHGGRGAARHVLGQGRELGFARVPAALRRDAARLRPRRGRPATASCGCAGPRQRRSRSSARRAAAAPPAASSHERIRPPVHGPRACATAAATATRSRSPTRPATWRDAGSSRRPDRACSRRRAARTSPLRRACRWTPVRGAKFYNVQLLRDGRKILSAGRAGRRCG